MIYSKGVVFACLLVFAIALNAFAYENTIIVVAEGLSDANFYKDRRVAYDEALKDAKRQALEKAVGAFVSSRTLIENYQTISDTLETRYQGFIKRIIKIVDGREQQDGFYHVWIKAEVYTKPLGEAVKRFTTEERRQIIKQYGNPTFAVKIDVISDENQRIIQQCDVCETEIADRLRRFGYRLVDWQGMEDYIRNQAKLLNVETGELASAKYSISKKPSDILVLGQVKLRRNRPVVIAGMTVQTVSLTSWSIRAIATHTNQIIFSKNFRPSKKAYNDEDEAIMDVGRMAGRLFSSDIFKNYVASPVREINLAVYGIKDRRIAKDFKRDLLSARSITGVRFREYYRGIEAVFDIDYVGTREEFTTYLNSEFLKALNRKYGQNTFVIEQESGNLVKIKVLKSENITRESINEGPPIAITVAPPARIKQVVKTKETLSKVARYNSDISSEIDDL